MPEDVSGLVGLLQGDGEVGKLLVNHRLVDMVGMTGSSATGKKIMQDCGKGLKGCVLELGGKDPAVVFADADLEKAADACVTNALCNAGQVCCSVERVYIEESAREQFEALCVERARDWVAGDGLREKDGVKLGPMVSAMQGGSWGTLGNFSGALFFLRPGFFTRRCFRLEAYWGPINGK